MYQIVFRELELFIGLVVASAATELNDLDLISRSGKDDDDQ